MNSGEHNRKNKSEYEFSLALLFYNEEENIGPVVGGLRDTLNAAGLDFQLILVDNGSSDRTPDAIRELVGGDPRLKAVTVEKNLGYGWGVINGLRAADGEWIGYMDGDGQVGPAGLLRVLRGAGSGCDLIKVRRALRLDGFARRWISNTYVMMFCLLFNLPFYDINAKPRIFRRKWLDLFQLSSRDWFVDAEMLAKARLLGLTVREIPVVFRKRGEGFSHINGRAILEFVKNIIRLRLGREMIQWKKKIRSR
ncbi:MAG: glycosyltransferase family 2 protein [PVC group bacterium]